jgi:hypothetical protein
MNHCNPIGASFPSIRVFYNADVRRRARASAMSA